MAMLVFVTFFVMAMVHESLGSYDLVKLLKEYPTWSFELESVESLIKNTVGALKDADPLMAEKILRGKVNMSLTPGSTHIVRKVGDPKWMKDPKELPLHFDAREKWEDCEDLINEIQDEGACNTDSPVAVASVMADRYCIFTNGASKKPLSSEMLAGCAEFCTEPQNITRSWNFATKNGIPTGGSKGKIKGCVPYELAPCLHGKNSSSIIGRKHSPRKLKPCSKYEPYDHVCPKKCTNPKYPKPLDQDQIKCKTYYVVSNDQDSIKNEIFTHGPVVTSVILYDDFYERPKGIYRGKKDRKFVAPDKYFKLIGWGEENNIKYWLAVNTWDQWGKKVFKFPRGVNYDWVEYILTACLFANNDD